MGDRAFIACAAAIGLCTMGLTVAFVKARHATVPEAEVENRPIQVPENRYVSSDSCKACHPREYDSWHVSFHRTMTQVPRPDTVVPSFDQITVDAVRGRPMRLERRDDEFWAEFDDPDARRTGGPPPRITRQVVLTTGSHQQQQFWYATGRHRLLGKLPAVYLVNEKRWIPRRAAFMHPPDELRSSETGAWNAVCIGCHTTAGKPEIDTPFGSRPVLQQFVNSKVGEFGIACEACHGPGEEHVQLNRLPQRRYWFHLTGEADSTITQPIRLSPQRSSQVCGQCHGIWEFYDLAGERDANSNGLPYRPGGELREARFIAQPTTNLTSSTMKELVTADPTFLSDSFWSDGMVRVSGREYNGLLDSPCFAHARGSEQAMTCFSCHTMHKKPDDPRSQSVWADTHQLSAGMDGNEACLQCHQKLRANLGAHTRHTEASANNCYNCHMPYTTYGLLRALRSHQVSSPSVAASVATGRPNACNLCHLDKTLAWTSESLRLWYGTPMPVLSADERTISASLLWLLRGDAGQRALIAWGMAWRPAQQAAGTGWMAPMLAQLLDDPYDAIRLIAGRSLRQLPGFAGFRYDFLASGDAAAKVVSSVIDIWLRTRSASERRTDAELLFGADGNVKPDLVTRLKQQRDNRRLNLRE